jgi:hypothetical protein
MMKSVVNGFMRPFFLLLPLLALPGSALAGQARASLQVSVQVVRGFNPAASALITQVERIETAGSQGSTSPVVNSGAECMAIGSTAIANDVWATCSWEPVTRMYLVTIQY